MSARLRCRVGTTNEHARVEHDAEAGCYFLVDLDSTNGTEVDGTKVTGRERLGPLHVIALGGKLDTVFEDLDLEAARQAGSVVRCGDLRGRPKIGRFGSVAARVIPEAGT